MVKQKKTKAEIRVAIAKDVIASLNKIIPTNGIYFGIDYRFDRTQLTKKKNSKVLAEKLKKNCEVCALGACFISAVKLTNEWDFSGLRFSGGYPKLTLEAKLLDYFTQEQLELIECAFERCSSFGHNLEYEKAANAASFKENIEDPTERLEAIMKNIISNKGSFRPNKHKKITV